MTSRRKKMAKRFLPLGSVMVAATMVLGGLSATASLAQSPKDNQLPLCPDGCWIGTITASYDDNNPAPDYGAIVSSSETKVKYVFNLTALDNFGGSPSDGSALNGEYTVPPTSASATYQETDETYGQDGHSICTRQATAKGSSFDKFYDSSPDINDRTDPELEIDPIYTQAPMGGNIAPVTGFQLFVDGISVHSTETDTVSGDPENCGVGSNTFESDITNSFVQTVAKPTPADPTHIVGSATLDAWIGPDPQDEDLSWDLTYRDSPDSDADDLSDFLEQDVYGTDRFNPDTDGDGFSDGTEVHANPPSDPLDPNSIPHSTTPPTGNPTTAPTTAPMTQPTVSPTTSPPPKGAIGIRVVTTPAGSVTQFPFIGQFSATLTDNKSAGVNVGSGTYGETEQVPKGWYTQAITCTPGATGTLAVSSVIFEISSSESESCTFHMAEQAKTYVALGDSFQSGEGACYHAASDCHNYYVAGTNIVGTDECHRSILAYPYVDSRINDSTNMFDFACSGAVIEDLYAPMTRDGHIETGEGYQLAALKREANDPTLDVTTVTVGLSGNDANFTALIKTCVIGQLKPSSCESQAEKKGIVPNFEDIGYRTKAAYEQIATSAPDATVYVMGYPRLFARDPKGANTCVVRLGDANWMNTVDAKLNSTLASSAAAANHDGYRVVYVDQYDAFTNHERCRDNDNDSIGWLNGILKSDNLKSPHSETFHPNAYGQAQFAFDLTWCAARVAIGYCKPPAPAAPAVKVSQTTVKPGGSDTVSAGGFIPGDTISITLHSKTVKVGTFKASPTGIVKFRFKLPKNFPAGRHTLVLRGKQSRYTITVKFMVIKKKAKK